MNVNDYNDPIAESLDEITRLRDEVELKDQILKSVAQQGIEQQRLITELCDALEAKTSCVEDDDIALIKRARCVVNP